MTQIRGQYGVYDQVGQREDLSDAISMVDPILTPLLSFIFVDGVASGIKHEWLEDALVSNTDTCSTVTTSALTITVANGDRFRTGQLILIDSERMYVSNVATNTLTVTRGYGASTSAAHTTGATVTIISTALRESQDALDNLSTVKDRKNNYCQAVSDTLLLSRRIQRVSVAGPKEFSWQTRKKIIEMKTAMERTLIWGTYSAGSNSLPSTTRGLVEALTTNTSTSVGVLSRQDLEDTYIRTLLDNGVEPGTMAFVGGATALNAMRTWQAAALQTRVGDSKFGATMKTYTSALAGDIPMVYNPQMATGSLFILCRRAKGIPLLKKAWLSRYAMTRLAKTGDADKWFTVADFAAEIRNVEAHYYLTGITDGA